MRGIVVVVAVCAALLVGAVVAVERHRAASASTAAQGGGIPDSGAGSPEQAQETIRRLREERDAAVKERDARIAKLEKELAEAQAVLVASVGKAADGRDPKAEAEERQRKLEKLIGEVDWAKYGKALLAFIKADEEARRAGKATKHDPMVIALLAEYYIRLQQLAKLMGLENPFDVPDDPRILPYVLDGLVEATGVAMTDEQRKAFHDKVGPLVLDFEKRGDPWDGVNKLDRLAMRGERMVETAQQFRGIMTPEQYEQFGKEWGTDPFIAQQTQRTMIRGANADETGKGVADHWMKAFRLPADQRAVVDDVANQYARDADAKVTEFQSRPGQQTIESQMALRVDLLRLQIEAERQVQQRVVLPPADQVRLKAGSGSVIEMLR
ncbi:MAG: hypothetical protein AAB434_05015 [Planctomycetota bacterium]